MQKLSASLFQRVGKIPQDKGRRQPTANEPPAAFAAADGSVDNTAVVLIPEFGVTRPGMVSSVALASPAVIMSPHGH